MLLDLADARRLVLEACAPPQPGLVPLDEAVGWVVAADVLATEEVPPFANTAVDGFGVRAVDVVSAPVSLEVVGVIRAGMPPEPPVGPGQAVRILTGAPIPEGVDAVVMVEDTDAWDGRTGREAAGPTEARAVEIRRTVALGDNLRSAGSDIPSGAVVAPAGALLTPARVGILASVGVREVPVFPRPRVGVLSTGDELVEGGGALRPGQIRDSNRHMLLAAVAASGFEPVDLGIAADDEDVLTGCLQEGVARCDAVLTSGGVSVGDFDYVKVVLDRLSGGGFSWMQVAIRPAKPFAFGLVGTTPVFGLPGNPVSSLVSFECFARPALRRMAGHAALLRPTVRAVADSGLDRRPDGKLHLVRVRAAFGPDGRLHVGSSGGQSSHHLHAMAEANALALVPDGDGIPPGGDADVWVLDL